MGGGGSMGCGLFGVVGQFGDGLNGGGRSIALGDGGFDV